MTDQTPNIAPNIAFMELALKAAHEAAEKGEVPVGAVLVGPGGAILATAHNGPIGQHDPTAHAEINVIRQACQNLGNYRLPEGCALYVTLEPCAMCAAAISQSRVSHIFYGATDPKGGAIISGPQLYGWPTIHWRPETSGGLMADAASDMLKAFFKARRK